MPVKRLRPRGLGSHVGRSSFRQYFFRRNYFSGSIRRSGGLGNAARRIGWHTSVRGGCYVSHDVVVGCHCHLGANSVISGGTTIGDAVFVGALAFVKNGLTIENAVHIAPGAAVFRSMPRGARGVGNPARVIGGSGG